MRWKWTCLFLFVLLSGCSAVGPTLSESDIQPVEPDKARLYFYRLPALYGSALRPPVLLDGESVGISVSGSVFFVDTSPGSHTISITSDSERILLFELSPDESVYVRMDMEPGVWIANVRPVLVAPELGRHEVRDLSVITNN